MVKIKFKKTHELAKLPTKNHTTDTGWDVYAVESVTINPGESKVVEIGLTLADITPGYWLQVAPRSGLGFKHNLGVHPGTIDQDYRSGMGILIKNTDLTKPYTFNVGDRCAQLIVYEVIPSECEFTDTITDTVRGANGFGSSGK